LSPEQQAHLVQDLEAPPADGGLWTGRKVARWIETQTGLKVHPQRGREYLRRIRFSKRVLRPRHAKADPAAQAEFKNLPERVKELQRSFPEASVELWATDQHRVGLKPILRRVWVRKGSRPTVSVQHRFQWLYVYSFVHPASGKTEWFLLPTVNAQVFTLALAHFAQAVGAGPKKRVLLVLDRAGWHTSQELEVPEGIHLLFLPPYFPELQPCERLWPLTNEGVANRSFRTLDELETVQVERCALLQNQPDVIRSATHFHWWPPSHSNHH